MSWNSSNGEETTIQDNAPFSDQSKIISNALREADRVMKNANYVFSSKSAATVDERTHNDDNGSESSSYDETTDIAIRKGVDARIRESTYNEPTTGLNKSPLNLKENDIQFQIIADVIVSKYEHFLKTGTKTFSVSIVDKQQLDRMVARDNFVEAVRFRLHSCPEDSQKQIHVLTRKCRALGLHRLGNQNLLFAPAGTVIEIEVSG